MIDSPRLRILLVTRNLPPLIGGMERLNWHMAEELSRVTEVHVIGPAGAASLAPANVTMYEAPLQPLWKFLLRARGLARYKARIWRPDIVLAGSGLTAPIARSAASLCGAKTCVYVHGLDVAVKHPVYRAIWLRALRSMDRIIANSNATAELCRGIGIDPGRIGIVHPGVDLPDSSELRGPREFGMAEKLNRNDPVFCQAALRFRQRQRLGDRPLLLSVGRLSARKGLLEFVTHALPRIVSARPDVMLLIVGDVPSHALRAEAQTPERIRVAADAVGVGQNLRFLGKVPDAELIEVYCAANVHVFPIRQLPDDPEGFGMVAVEAAAHGLPTVAFATGGVVDAVAESESGRLVEPGNYLSFADAVLQMLMEADAWRPGCMAFASRFAWQAFGRKIVAQLPEALDVGGMHA